MDVFNVFILCKCYQIVQSVSVELHQGKGQAKITRSIFSSEVLRLTYISLLLPLVHHVSIIL